MGNIVLLDDLTINQIAAGEVIERPASAIKEMLENSIDAGAKNVTIEVKNGGISLIRITDDGSGIAADDMEIAFERHATSKIRSAKDLINVKSMGFRGEALASIAAISKVEMISKRAESETGNKIVLEGGDVLEKTEVGAPVGTRITVENLFYNTPVRYKFLKKDYTETGYIEDVVTRIALVNKNVSITLISNGKTILHTSGDGETKSVIYSVFGKDIANGVVDVDYTYEDMKVTGVIGKPSIAKSNRGSQLFFINNRFVKDKTLTAAVDQAFRNVLPIGKFAFAILNIEMDSAKVDVNVHPAKLEVRFQDESSVFKAVYHAIKATIEKKENQTVNAKATNSSDLNEIKEHSIETPKTENSSSYTTTDKNVNNDVTNITSEIVKNTMSENLANKLNENISNLSNNEIVEEKKMEKTSTFGNLFKKIWKDKKEEEPEKEENNLLKDIYDSRKNEHTVSDNTKELDFNVNDKLKEVISKTIEIPNEIPEIKIAEEQYTKKIEAIKIPEENQYTQEFEKIEESQETQKIESAKVQVENQETQQVESVKVHSENQETQKVESIKVQSENQETQKIEAVKVPVETQYTQEIEGIKIPEDIQCTQEIENVKASTDIQEIENREIPNKLQHTQIMNFEKESNEGSNKENAANTTENNITNFDVSNSITEKLLEQKFKEDMQDTQMIDTSKVRAALKEQETPKEFEEMYKKTFGIETVAVRKEKEQEEKEISASEDFKYANQENESMFEKEEFKQKINYKFIGIVFEKYVTIEISNEMYMIDYGAMYERLMYEDFKNNYYNDEKKDSQILLLPDIITLTNKEMFIAKQNLSMFEKAGFQYEEFGENTIKLTAVPSVCEKLNTKKLFIEILDELNTVAVTENEEKEKKFIATIAYKVTEKTNLKIEESEIDKLLQRLLSLENPFTYPYGRPSAIKMTRYDLERKFSRR